MRVDRRSGDRLREIEALGLLRLAEVRRVEELLQADHDLRAAAGGFADALDGALDVLRRVGGDRFLNQSDRERRSAR